MVDIMPPNHVMYGLRILEKKSKMLTDSKSIHQVVRIQIHHSSFAKYNQYKQTYHNFAQEHQ